MSSARREFMESRGGKWGKGIVRHTSLISSPNRPDHASEQAAGKVSSGSRVSENERRMLWLSKLNSPQSFAIVSNPLPTPVASSIRRFKALASLSTSSKSCDAKGNRRACQRGNRREGRDVEVELVLPSFCCCFAIRIWGKTYGLTLAISLMSLSCSLSNSVRPSKASEGEVVDSKMEGARDLR